MPFRHSAARHPQRIAMNDFMKVLNFWETINGVQVFVPPSLPRNPCRPSLATRPPILWQLALPGLPIRG